MTNDLLVTNIGLLATPQGTSAQAGHAQGSLRLVREAAIAASAGKITYVGDAATQPSARHIVDAGGRLVTPGLVDAHTHLVFGGFRQHEFAAKLSGMPYMELLRMGGGILSTVRSTREMPQQALYAKSLDFLNRMLAHGTTCAEIKSGYGLDLQTELVQLQVIMDLGKQYSIAATFMGAHAIPAEYADNKNDYVDYIIDEMLPVVASRKLARFCDVFCENGAFDLEQSRRILRAAREYGFGTKIHADEITAMGAAGLAAEMGAISAEHLLQASDADLGAMARAGVIAVLLPATSFYLGKNYARGADMINMHVPVALATDFNPGSSPCYNMQIVLNLACLRLGLSPAQALVAATLNAAAAIGFADAKGSLEVGKDADIVIWDAPDLDFLLYRFGNNQVYEVIKGGWQPRNWLVHPLILLQRGWHRANPRPAAALWQH